MTSSLDFNDQVRLGMVDADEPPAPPECEQCHESLSPDLPLKERKQHIPEIAVVTTFEYLTCPLCGWDTVIAWRDVETGNPPYDRRDGVAFVMAGDGGRGEWLFQELKAAPDRGRP